jgi:hypothetical protein
MRLSPVLALAGLLASGAAISPTASSQSAPTSAAQPVKVAEGSYGPFDDWILWRTPEGYRVDMQMHWADAKGALQTEFLRLTPEFHMKGVQYDVRNFSALPDGALDCDVQEKSLECTSSFKGSEGKGSIPVAGAYAAQFGVEMAFLDMPWFFASLVSHADRKPGITSEAGVVWLAFDGPTPEQLVTANPRTSKIKFLGREKISVVGRSVNSFKFQVEARHLDSTVWTSESGLLLAFDWGGLRMDLTRYQQYEVLIPELSGGELKEIPPPPPVRTKVAEGGFYYSSEAAGQFIGGWTDDWVLWRTAEGYELETNLHTQGRPEKSRVSELLRMSPDFRITYFRENNPSWDEQKDGYYECGLKQSGKNARLECRNTMWGNEAASVIPISPPYVFELAEKAILIDWPWFYASLVSTAARDPRKPTQVPILFLSSADEKAGSREATPVTGRKEIQFLGREQITILGRSIPAYKYLVKDEMTVWVSLNGMPLALQNPIHPRHWELKRYKQYEPLIPELH